MRKPPVPGHPACRYSTIVGLPGLLPGHKLESPDPEPTGSFRQFQLPTWGKDNNMARYTQSGNLPAAILLFALLILLESTLIPKIHGVRAEASLEGCQCTDYVYRQRQDLPGPMGHARDWILSASSYGLPYDHTPQVGDVAVILNGEHGFNSEYGHVAVVIGVNREHTLFDIAGYDGTRNNCMVEVYTRLPVSSSTTFIHRLVPNYR